MPAYAQNFDEQGPGPTFIRGAFTLESSLGIEALDNDNIFESATNVQSSLIWRLAPSLLMRFEPARSRLEFTYDGDYGWYDQSSDDDYTDHVLEAGAYLLLGESSGLDLVGTYQDVHENRGTGLTQGIDPESVVFPQDPDLYSNKQFLADYTYGVSDTRAFVAIEASTLERAYKNHLARTQQFDHADTYGEVTLGIRVRPKTSLQLRLRALDISYEHPRISGLNPDSRENRYLVGVVWEATRKTTGTVLIGRVEKKFDEPSRPNLSVPNWEVAIRWSPRTYSHFDLGTQRFTEEPVDVLGDVTDTANYSLGWTHEWNDRMESKIAMSRADQTYRFVTGDRNDETLQYSIALIYTMRPWLRWEAGLDVKDRDSDGAALDYDQTIARLGAWITF